MPGAAPNRENQFLRAPVRHADAAMNKPFWSPRAMGPTYLPALAAQFERMLLASIDSQLQISPSVVKVTSRA